MLLNHTIAAFIIGTEENELACRAVLTCFELHFYISANEERSNSAVFLKSSNKPLNQGLGPMRNAAIDEVPNCILA